MGFCKLKFSPFIYLPIFWLVACLWPPNLAPAADPQADSWQVLADQITHYKDPERVVASGNVLLQKIIEGKADDSMVITADSLNYDIASGIVEAWGNLVIKDQGDEIKADEGLLNLKQGTSTLKNASLFRKKDNMHIAGDEFKKTGKLTYQLQNSWLTTCEIPADQSPSWSFSSKDTKITKGGYASMKHVFFRVRNVPLLYTPYMIIPAGTERKTGFLFPEYTQGERDGTGLLAPFFINLSPSHDLTLYPGFHSKRGARAGMEFRYIADQRSRGFVSANYLSDSTSDKVNDDYKSDGYLRSNSNRYWLRGKVDHDFGDNLTGHADLDLVSDRDYLQEFDQGRTGFEASNQDYLHVFQRGFQDETIYQRENTVQLSKTWPTMTLNGELRLINDAQDQPTTTTPLWAVPRLTFSGISPVRRTPLELSWETEYIYYWREKGLGAHRLDLHPQITAPLPLGPYVEANVIGGLRETLYMSEVHGNSSQSSWSGDRFQNRILADFKTNIATTLVRDFNIESGDLNQLRHWLRPNVGYSYIPYNDQSNLPNLDGIDRISAVNNINYGINNYFTVSDRMDFLSSSRDLGYFNVSQVFNLRNSKHPYSDLLFEMGINPSRNMMLKYENAVSVYGQGVNYYNLKSSYAHQNGHNLNVDYHYKRNQNIVAPFFYTDTAGETIHEITAGLQAKLTSLLLAKYDITQSFATDRIVGSSLSLLYNPSCWSMELVASSTPDDSRLMVVFSLSGIGQPMEFGLPKFYN